MKPLVISQVNMASMAAAQSSNTQETKQIEEKKKSWEKVHQEIEESPYCARAGKPVKVLHYKKCYLYGKNYFEPFCCTGGKNGLCHDCATIVSHYLGYPIYDVLEYGRAFIKFY